MDPATIALILSSLASATKYGFELAELLRKGQAGEIDEAEALRRYYAASEAYAAARAGWDAAQPEPKA